MQFCLLTKLSFQFRRLIARELQKDAKEQQQGTKSKPETKEQTKDTKDTNPNTTPVPEATQSNPPKPPTKVTLFKNPLPGVVCLQSPPGSVPTTTSGQAPGKPPNILRMGRQILIRPKYSLASTGGPNKVMLSSPSTAPFRARAPTVRTLLNMTPPFANLSKDQKSKLLFPVKMIKKGSPEVSSSSASQRPYILVGSASQRPIAPATQVSFGENSFNFLKDFYKCQFCYLCMMLIISKCSLMSRNC